MLASYLSLQQLCTLKGNKNQLL